MGGRKNNSGPLAQGTALLPRFPNKRTNRGYGRLKRIYWRYVRLARDAMFAFSEHNGDIPGSSGLTERRAKANGGGEIRSWPRRAEGGQGCTSVPSALFVPFRPQRTFNCQRPRRSPPAFGKATTSNLRNNCTTSYITQVPFCAWPGCDPVRWRERSKASRIRSMWSDAVHRRRLRFGAPACSRLTPNTSGMKRQKFRRNDWILASHEVAGWEM